MVHQVFCPLNDERWTPAAIATATTPTAANTKVHLATAVVTLAPRAASPCSGCLSGRDAPCHSPVSARLLVRMISATRITATRIPGTAITTTRTTATGMPASRKTTSGSLSAAVADTDRCGMNNLLTHSSADTSHFVRPDQRTKCKICQNKTRQKQL